MYGNVRDGFGKVCEAIPNLRAFKPAGVMGVVLPTGDGLDPHPLRPMQPTDLRPLIHVDHSPCLLARLEPGFAFHHIQWWTRHRGSKFGCR